MILISNDFWHKRKMYNFDAHCKKKYGTIYHNNWLFTVFGFYIFFPYFLITLCIVGTKIWLDYRVENSLHHYSRRSPRSRLNFKGRFCVRGTALTLPCYSLLNVTNCNVNLFVVWQMNAGAVVFNTFSTPDAVYN